MRGQYIIVFVTCCNTKEARDIAKLLVNERLAACVSIIPSVESIYMWKGKLERSRESLLIIKTRHSIYHKMECAILSRHSYDTPEIIAMPISKGNSKYLLWVDECTLIDNKR